MTSTPERRRNPWWIPPHLFGRVPAEVPAAAVKVLGIVSFALFFEHYDVSLLTNALKYIKDDLGIAESDLGYFQMMIRLGALPAIFLVPFADRFGRRRLFLISLVGMSVGTLLTGLAQTASQFVAFQMLTRMFVLTASAVAIVIVAEEMPASARGWGVGMLAAVSAFGHGAGAALFAAVEILPYGWRSLYAFGVIPLLLLPMFARNIRETDRFSALSHAEDSWLRAWFLPLKEFFSVHPMRALGMTLLAGGSSVGHVVVIAFAGYFVLEYHNWEPYHLSIMVLTAGVIGVLGNVMAGRLADRIGRKAVGLGFLVAYPALAWGFYNGPGWLLPAFWSMMVFTLMGANVIIRALASELFPTTHRGTSTGVLTMMETLGAALGMAWFSQIQHADGDLQTTLPLIALTTVLAGIVLLFFRETRQQELEKTSA